MDNVVKFAQQCETIRAYDAVAAVYDKYSEKYDAYLNAVNNLVIERLASGMRLLDVGSGNGRRLQEISAQHRLSEVVAVEPSSEMAAMCREKTGFRVHELFGENLDQLSDPPFDVITALWNVLGHIPSSSLRICTLINMKKKLQPHGMIMLDVNNRHNRLAYGRIVVLRRRFLDAFFFRESRGDVRFEWNIEGKTIPASGHLFVPREVETLFAQAGLEVVERWAVNYANGALSSSPFDGQLFYVLKHQA